MDGVVLVIIHGILVLFNFIELLPSLALLDNIGINLRYLIIYRPADSWTQSNNVEDDL